MYVAEPAIFATRNGCPAVVALMNFWRAHAPRVSSPENENDNAVTFAPPLCCRKPLTNSGCAVVEGGRESSFAGV